MNVNSHQSIKLEAQMKYVLVILVILILLMLMTGCAQQGNMGNDGPAGQDSKPITIVQFCKNQGPTTPGHYPEQGLCINEKIYAVYWDGNNSFLAEVIPGSYISTSTGLQCSFSVINGCNIQ